MTEIVSRSQWGARAAKPGGNRFSTILGTAVHWEAAPPPADHAKCDDAVRAVQNFHMDVNRWNDIAYNLVACNHNYLYEGRQGGTAANGTNYGNEHFPAVCWLGGPGHTPTPEALTAISFARSKLGGLGRPIYPHNHFLPTQCPGVVLTKWVNDGAHPPKQDPPPAEPNHFFIKWTKDDGTPDEKWTDASGNDQFGRDAQDNHPDAPFVYVVTIDPKGEPPA